MMLTETLLSRASRPAALPSAQHTGAAASLPPAIASTASALPVRLPLKAELQAMSFEERVSALMACADHHLEQMDLLEDPERSEPLTAWERRQLTSHRGSLRRVLERASEFGIKISVVEE
jgi:hypothetical protein